MLYQLLQMSLTLPRHEVLQVFRHPPVQSHGPGWAFCQNSQTPTYLWGIVCHLLQVFSDVTFSVRLYLTILYKISRSILHALRHSQKKNKTKHPLPKKSQTSIQSPPKLTQERVKKTKWKVWLDQPKIHPRY